MPLGQMRFNAERNIATCSIFSHQIKNHRGFNIPLHNTTQHIVQVQSFKMMWNWNHFLSNISNRNTILGNQNLMVNFLLRKTFRGNLNEEISLAKISSFRCLQLIFFKRKLIFRRQLNVWSRKKPQ